MNRFTFLSISFLLTAVACTRQVPQLPSNKAFQVDSAAVSMQLANEKLISGEDSIIQVFVEKSSVDFEKSPSGLWYNISKLSTNEDKAQHGQNCRIDYRVYSFDNLLLFNETKNFVVGKKQLINGLEEVFLQLSRGDSAVAVVPWYIGYGMKGNQDIPPYTSVVVRVKRIK